ncbi:hypothetical protein COX11_02950 [Candidatus Berkelbacteria bacterium CG23_combo_of_CG06-09_8_20_14_all_41_73]|uniref:Uncharacterized protein n=1 Tax=Candidatus Berkelbacteria bacterium CG23_combo_of_CG06-09_8_20_14_all_41_73 TaxID=1974519 RepID=A0A2H0AZ45_9BACT|nr:MAG: hypothetical protein COX11_02950 [Candidatus Berkelbacteria bacterium CG23_combo_of_CG06-09_8_20_14_all_41_73]
MKLNRKGLMPVEYALLLVLAVIVAIIAWETLGINVSEEVAGTSAKVTEASVATSPATTASTPTAPDLSRIGDAEMEKWMLGKTISDISAAGFYEARLLIAPNGRVYAVGRDLNRKIQNVCPLASAKEPGQ